MTGPGDVELRAAWEAWMSLVILINNEVEGSGVEVPGTPHD